MVASVAAAHALNALSATVDTGFRRPGGEAPRAADLLQLAADDAVPAVGLGFDQRAGRRL